MGHTDNPHREYTFDITPGERLNRPHCPDCGRQTLSIELAYDHDKEFSYESDELLWLCCWNCDWKSLPRRGLPVEMPLDDIEPTRMVNWILERLR